MEVRINRSFLFVDRAYAALKRVPLWSLAILWLLPSIGLFVSSFRPRDSHRRSGWWSLEPNGLDVRFTAEHYRHVFEAGVASPLGDSLRSSVAIAVPALAAFAILQFLWTWNDYFIAAVMLGSSGGEHRPSTMFIANLYGAFTNTDGLLMAGAFVQAFVPVCVFLALQRFFVRGLLTGPANG